MQNYVTSFISDRFPNHLSFASKCRSTFASRLLGVQIHRLQQCCRDVLAAVITIFLTASLVIGQQPQPALEEQISRGEVSAQELRLGEVSKTFHEPQSNVTSSWASPPSESNAPRTWSSVEYLLWSIDRYSIPSLATSSSVGTPASSAGVLNSANTTSLLDSEFGNSVQSGYKIGLGGWLDGACKSGYEVNYMSLPSQSVRNTFDSGRFPILARPVFDATLGQEAASIVAFPSVLSGNLTVTGSSDLQFVEGLFRERWFQGPSTRVDFLVGCQYGGLHEKLSIDQFSQFLSSQGPIVAGTSKQLSDEFETRNQFYGGVLGFDYRERLGWSRISIQPSLAFGMNESKVDIRGSTTTTVPGAGSANFSGALLAQSTNIGSYSDRTLIVLPAFSVRLQTPLSAHWQLTIGYNLHYWSSAVRPGSQIDRVVSQFPPETPTGERHPAFSFEKEGVLIHGLQTGLVFSY